ncbi:MAG: argininosuccinate lyase [Oscillospiraceae bacterium]|jgi:argininosuccinate lyase|nr:argininosuccinate lyase [Oscillospiraceae bacterium]
MDKLWKGRFEKELSPLAKRFNDSFAVDKALLPFDILASIAHASMLGKQAIITENDSALICAALSDMLAEYNRGTLLTGDETDEDVHSFLERKLTEKLGDIGKKVHTARSRNDQVATAFRLYCADRADGITAALIELIDTITDIAAEHTDTIMPGYTHLQRAQPITYAHWLNAYKAMFTRDKERISDARRRTMSECPLGSGALAGTSFNIDRAYTADKLDFASPCGNSLDGVSDRDFCLELLSALSVIAVHLSRLSEELILFSSAEFKFVTLDDTFSTGSSIMPQKKNPDISELIRGKTGRVFGAMTAMFTAVKGLPLAYNKDLQEDKEIVIGAFDTVSDCLLLSSPLLRSLTVNKDKMRRACADGFINATDCADYLAKKGLPFRDAYKITGQIVAHCEKEHLTLETLPLEQYKAYTNLFEDDIYTAVNLDNCLKTRTSYGGAGGVTATGNLGSYPV